MVIGRITQQECNSFANVETPQRCHLSHGNGRIYRAAHHKESEIYFADFNDVVIGEDGNMKVSFSQEASYQDGDGNLVSAFSRNQSLIRVVTEHDIGFRHPEGLVLGTKVLF